MRNEGAHPRSGDLVRQIEHALGRRVTSMRPLGAGVDHVTFEIDGDLVAKVTPDRRGDTARHVDREARLLELIGPRLPVAVPKVVAIDPPGGLLVLTKIEGTSLLDRPSPEPERLVPTLVAVLGALRSIPSTRTADVAELDDAAPQDWLDEAAATYTRIAVHLESSQRREVERFLAATPPAPPQIPDLCHNDLGAEHLIADDNHELAGIIDWSDAALADVAVDLGRLGRDLGPLAASRIATELGLDDATVRRAAFYARCTLLEDLDHGVATGDHRYRDAALAYLSRTLRWRPS